MQKKLLLNLNDITMSLLHEKENSQDTERHLVENTEKFESDCVFLYKMMLSGKRLTTQDVRDMKIDDRRLRNLFQEGKCEREWMLNVKGKRTHVEYFVPRVPYPSKTEVIKNANKTIEILKSVGKQVSLF